MVQLPQCRDCDDNIPHSVVGYCLVADDSPVLLVTTVDCQTGYVTTTIVDAITGLAYDDQLIPIKLCNQPVFVIGPVDVNVNNIVPVDIQSIVPVEIIEPVTVDGSVSITNSSIEISNDIGNPVPISGTVTITDGAGPVTIDGTVSISGQVSVNGLLEHLGRSSHTIPNSPALVTLVPPVGSQLALIENSVTGNRAIRWTGDPLNPPLGGGISGNGHYLVQGASIEYIAEIADLRFTKDSNGGNCVLEVSYYRYL